MKTSVSLFLCAGALALAGCGQQQQSSEANAGQAEQEGQSAETQTIAEALQQDGKFFQAAKAVGLDSTLAGPGPYTVLVPGDEAFAKLENGPLTDSANPANRAEITRVLTYHILPGVILAEDISKAIDNGQGNTVLATMGGETLAATKEGDKIVLTDSAGNKATIGQADQKVSNGAIHRIDSVLVPSASDGEGEGSSAQ
jgi:uncharacterized surface protein with fasciclin (FAS1) repeats